MMCSKDGHRCLTDGNCTTTAPQGAAHPEDPRARTDCPCARRRDRVRSAGLLLAAFGAMSGAHPQPSGTMPATTQLLSCACLATFDGHSSGHKHKNAIANRPRYLSDLDGTEPVDDSDEHKTAQVDPDPITPEQWNECRDRFTSIYGATAAYGDMLLAQIRAHMSSDTALADATGADVVADSDASEIASVEDTQSIESVLTQDPGEIAAAFAIAGIPQPWDLPPILESTVEAEVGPPCPPAPAQVPAPASDIVLISQTTTLDESGQPCIDEPPDAIPQDALAMRTNSRGSSSEQDRSGPLSQRSGDSIIESIQVRGERAEQLVVPRNSSAVINLKQKADAVEIADPNIADVVLTSPTRVIVSGKSYGTTELSLRVDGQQRTLTVSVELDVRTLQYLIRSIAPTSDVHIRTIGGMIVLLGSVPDVETADRVAELASLAQGGEVKNQLNIAGVQQTMLRVVVAEVNKTALRMLGVNWSVGGSPWSRDFFFSNNLNQINPTFFGFTQPQADT